MNFTDTSSFTQNWTFFGGAINLAKNVVLTFNETSIFINNSAEFFCGAIFAIESTVLIFSGNSTFFNNHVNIFGEGGAICTSRNAVLSFSGISNFNNSAAIGGAINANVNTSLGFIGASNFTNNSAENGGAIHTAYNAVLTFNGTNNFNNSANIDGAIFALVNISLDITGTSNFSSNSAMQGGAISANINSTLTFKFTNNGHNTDKLRDSHGGAMYLVISSTISILPHTTICWEKNIAILGGAIYVLNVNPFIHCTVTRVSTSTYTKRKLLLSSYRSDTIQ